MLDISTNPRLIVLVGRIERLYPGVDTSDAPAEVRGRILSTYQEIGRYVHWLLRQDRVATAEILAAVANWGEDSAGDPGAAVAPPSEVWGPPVPTVATEAIDEADGAEPEPLDLSGVILPLAEDGAFEEAREPVSVSVRTAASALSGVSFAVASGEPEWVDTLRELLRALGEPGIASAGEDRARMEAATDAMELRWLPYPPSAQLALLGMLASRARAIEPMLDGEEDVRGVLARLNRYRESLGLSLVPALAEPPVAEYGSWAEDARMWWSILSSAIPAER